MARECVSLARMSGDENRGGTFTSTSDPLLLPLWFRKLTWVSWLRKSIKTRVPAPELSSDILLFHSYCRMENCGYCHHILMHFCWLWATIFAHKHSRVGTSAQWQRLWHGLSLYSCPKSYHFFPHAHLYSFPFWYFPQIQFNQILLLMWTLLKAFHLPISQLLPS